MIVTALIGVIAVPLYAFALFLSVFAPFLRLPFGRSTNLAFAAVLNACQALGDVCLGNQLPI